MMSESSSDESLATGKDGGIPSCYPQLTQGVTSDSDLSGDGLKHGGGEGQRLSTGEGSSVSVVMVAQPPRGSGKESGLQEIALTGSEALDVLDRVRTIIFFIHM